MFMPAVFHENLFDDFFDPFWNDGVLERAMNREERETFGKRGANMMKTDVKQMATMMWLLTCPAARRKTFRWS